jgi:hypothetical protein
VRLVCAVIWFIDETDASADKSWRNSNDSQTRLARTGRCRRVEFGNARSGAASNLGLIMLIPDLVKVSSQMMPRVGHRHCLRCDVSPPELENVVPCENRAPEFRRAETAVANYAWVVSTKSPVPSHPAGAHHALGLRLTHRRLGHTDLTLEHNQVPRAFRSVTFSFSLASPGTPADAPSFFDGQRDFCCHS